LAKYLDRAFNEFMKVHHPKLCGFPMLDLSDVVSDAEEVVRAEIAIHEGGYDERAGVILSMVEGDTEGAFALTEETKLPPTAQADLDSLRLRDHEC
jgi:hypothetical protein